MRQRQGWQGQHEKLGGRVPQRRREFSNGRQRQHRGWPRQPALSLPGARATPAQLASGGGCLTTRLPHTNISNPPLGAQVPPDPAQCAGAAVVHAAGKDTANIAIRYPAMGLTMKARALVQRVQGTQHHTALFRVVVEKNCAPRKKIAYAPSLWGLPVQKKLSCHPQ